jgi:hypothetical protein
MRRHPPWFIDNENAMQIHLVLGIAFVHRGNRRRLPLVDPGHDLLEKVIA